MQELFTTLLPIIGPGGVGILAAWLFYLKINSQRKESKNDRDTEIALMKKDIDYLKEETSTFKQDIKDIKETLQSMQISITKIASALENRLNKREE